jgi:hypothetical protein
MTLSVRLGCTEVNQGDFRQDAGLDVEGHLGDVFLPRPIQKAVVAGLWAKCEAALLDSKVFETGKR